MELNSDQQAALATIKAHVAAGPGSNPFLVFKGPAGTGKTFTISHLPNETRKKIIFTAPTNKATKVLRDTLKSKDYDPDTCTIYSLLGLRMEANGELKELTVPDDDVDLSEYGVVVVDEGGMLNEQVIGYIHRAAKQYPAIRWIIMGDPYQLPPVGESFSQVWSWDNQIELTKIMRQDNTIIALAQHVRDHIEKPFSALTLTRTADVKPLSAGDFSIAIVEAANEFALGTSKTIAWRNVVVDRYNALIRRELFADHEKYLWQEADRITMLGPIQDLLRTHPETGAHPKAASTDDEGVVRKAEVVPHPLFPEFDCWRIYCTLDDNKSLTLFTLHASQKGKYDARLARMAAEAKVERRKWRAYWEFRDAFHPVRHAYAITAHRAQGSTYERAYVNWRDILLNPQKDEAYRCLYVACTRPKKELILG